MLATPAGSMSVPWSRSGVIKSSRDFRNELLSTTDAPPEAVLFARIASSNISAPDRALECEMVPDSLSLRLTFFRDWDSDDEVHRLSFRVVDSFTRDKVRGFGRCNTDDIVFRHWLKLKTSK